jgi:hypothetical protein
MLILGSQLSWWLRVRRAFLSACFGAVNDRRPQATRGPLLAICEWTLTGWAYFGVAISK